MTHRIGRREAIDTALWRLLREDLAKARPDLRSGGARDERVHGARQRLKRARSLTRVLDPAIGDAAGAIRKELGSVARLLAHARDADAAAASARGIREIVGSEDDAGFTRVVAELDRKAEEAHRGGAPVAEILKRLAAVEARVGALSGEMEGTELFARALFKAYGSGRKAMRRARSSLSTPDLHKWRKQVKQLCHLLRLARKRLPDGFRKTADDLDVLGELLGDDHDHAMLAEKLALSPHADPALKRQLSIIADERNRLEAEAFLLGEKLFKRRPKAFPRRVDLR